MIAGMGVSRRGLLAGGTALVAAGVGLRPGRGFAQDAALPEYVDFKVADALIVHSDNTIETRRDAFGTSLVTPENKLYIRNNISPPSEEIVADRDAWEVSIEGVANPRTLTVGELKRLGVETVAMVLQCSGNGRGVLRPRDERHPVAGRRRRQRDLDRGAALDGGRGAGRRRRRRGLHHQHRRRGPARGHRAGRSSSSARCRSRTSKTPCSAWDMNGEPISLAHGGPLRMIVPGYYGVNNVKYVKRVAFTEAETEARIQSERYRLQPVGEEGGPEHPSVWEMNVKSFITAPLEGGPAGMTQIAGVAFSGGSGVAGVEVSVDDGETWSAAEFVGPDMGPYAWRTFVLPVELAAGTHRLVSRATDGDGNVQPRDMEPNDAGYNHNGWYGHGVEVTVS
jgi:sulfite oxidase